LILIKIIKIVATRRHILRLKCTKFYFGKESLQRSPRPPSWILGGLLLRRGRGEKGREGEGKEEQGIRGGGKGRKRRGKEGKGGERMWPPPMKISAYAPGW